MVGAVEPLLAVISALASLQHATQTGDERGLDRVTERARAAVRAQQRPDDLLYGALIFPAHYFLAAALLRRYEQVHSLESLTEAISLAEQLNTRWWLRGAARGPVRRLLSIGLHHRFERDGNGSDLDR